MAPSSRISPPAPVAAPAEGSRPRPLYIPREVEAFLKAAGIPIRFRSTVLDTTSNSTGALESVITQDLDTSGTIQTSADLPRVAGADERVQIKADDIDQRGSGNTDVVFLGSSETAGGLVPGVVDKSATHLDGAYTAFGKVAVLRRRQMPHQLGHRSVCVQHFVALIAVPMTFYRQANAPL